MTTYNVEIVINGRENASGPLGKVGSAMGNISQIAGGILSAQVFTGIANGITNMAGEALQSYAGFERLGMALQSLVARELLNTGQVNNMAKAMEMAKGQAAGLQEWITKLAIQSPFNQEDVAQSYRLAMAYGFTAKEAQRLTQATIDFAAGSGASGYSMQQIALALGQIKAKGKLAGGEVLQLTNAGLDVRNILAKAFGVTTEQLIEMQEKGLIPADKAIEAIVKSLEKDFGGAAKAQAATFSGLLASLEDIKSVGLREFFAGTFKAIQPYLTTFVDTLSSPEFMSKVRGFGESLGNMVSNLLKFGQAIANGNVPVLGMFDRIRAVMSRISPVIIQSGKRIWAAFIENAQKLAAQVMPWLLTQFEKFSTWFEKNEPLIKQFVQVVTDFIVTKLLPAITDFWKVVEPILNGIIDVLLGLITLIMQVFVGDWAGAWETIKKIVLDASTAIGNAIIAFLDWIAQRMGSSLAEIATTWLINGELLQIIIGKVWANINTGFTNWLNGLGITMSQLGAIVVYGWNNMWNSIFAYFLQMAAKLVTNVLTWTSNLKSSIEGAWNNIVSATNTFVSNLLNTIASYMTDFYNAGYNMISNIYSGLTSAVSSYWQNFLDIGGDIVDGIKTGISNAWDSFVSWLTGLLNELVQDMLDMLGLSSSSDAMANMGRKMMYGLADGIKSAVGAPQLALSTSSAGAGINQNYAATGQSYSNMRSTTNYYGPVTIETRANLKAQDVLKGMR